MDFFAPGLKRWQSTEWSPTNPRAIRARVGHRIGACSLQCDHCQGKVLKGMARWAPISDLFERARRLQLEGSEGLLVSGGSTRSGAVSRSSPTSRTWPGSAVSWA